MPQFPLEQRPTGNTTLPPEPMLSEAYVCDMLSQSHLSKFRFVRVTPQLAYELETASLVTSCLQPPAAPVPRLELTPSARKYLASGCWLFTLNWPCSYRLVGVSTTPGARSMRELKLRPFKGILS